MAIKRNRFESVLVRWINLEPVTQSEVSQKEKKYLLTHVYGICKNSTDEHLQSRNRDTDIENRLVETAGKERVGIERVALKDTYYHMQNRQLVESCCITQEAQPGAL